VSNVPEYNVTFPTKKVIDHDSYKEEIAAKDQVKDYVEKYNEHPRVKEYGLFLTKKWYFYTIAGACFIFFLMLMMLLLLLNNSINNIADKQLNPSFPISFEHNSTITSNTTNHFTNEVVNNHDIITQINLTMRYEIDSDAIGDIIDGVNEKIYSENIKFNMTCTFYNVSYNCSYDDVYFPVNFTGYFNKTKLNGTLKEI